MSTNTPRAVRPFDGATGQVELSKECRVAQWLEDFAVEFRFQINLAGDTIVEDQVQTIVVCVLYISYVKKHNRIPEKS